MNDEKVSVIVPVYNVEEYLEVCVKSILYQTYSNLQIILVDDGSTDNSGSICDELKDKFERIIVIHKINGGLSSARNSGLEIANGEYVLFVDSDDYIHPRTVELTLYTMNFLDVDLVEFEYKEIAKYEPCLKINEFPIELHKRDDCITGCFYWKKHYTTTWNKLYRRSKISNIKFEVGVLNEDEYYYNQIITKFDKMGYLGIPLYFYLQRENSIMGHIKTKSIGEKRLNSMIAYIERYEIYSKNYPTHIPHLLNVIIDKFHSNMQAIEMFENDKEKLELKLLDMIIPMYPYIMKSNYNNRFLKENEELAIKNPQQFILDYQKDVEAKKKLAEKQANNILTSNIIYRGAKCLYENGITYTIRRFFEKIKYKN